MNIQEKAKRYDEALESAKGIIEQNPLMEYLKKGIEYIFPELKESGDEKIRKALIRYFTLSDEHAYNEACGVSYRDIVAWLEKQGEKKPADKIEPTDYNSIAPHFAKPTDKIETKFHEGDWVVVSTSGGDKVVQIDSVEYFKDGHPSYITTEGRWFGNGTKARLLTDKDVKTITLPESKVIAVQKPADLRVHQ